MNEIPEQELARQNGSSKEIGTSGLEVYWGQVEKADNAKLYWPTCYELFNKYLRRDPQVAQWRVACSGPGCADADTRTASPHVLIAIVRIAFDPFLGRARIVVELGGTGAVIGKEDDERVVVQALAFQVVQEPAEMMIDVAKTAPEPVPGPEAPSDARR